MAAVAVLQPGGCVEGVNKNATTFITLVNATEPSSTSVPLDPTPPKPKTPLFILNNDAFIDLQLYVHSALHLPPSTQMFQATYPKQAFKDYFGSDPTLYDAMSLQLPEIHQHCLAAQGNTLGPMISLAGYIADFAGEAAKNTASLEAALRVITTPGLSMETTEAKEARSRARKVLRDLIKYAQNSKAECQETVVKLSNFAAITRADKEQVDLIAARLKKTLPDESARSSKLQAVIEQGRAAVKAMEKQLDEARQEAKEKGTLHWYHAIPWIGWVILLIDTIKSKGLVKTLGELKTKYDDERARTNNEEAQLLVADAQVSGLANSFSDIEKTIKKAIDAVEHMMKAFSNLETGFSSMRNKLEQVEGDVDEDYISDRIVAFEDLAEAKETWAQVYDLAKKFQDNGIILPAPKEVVAEKH